MIFSTTPLAGAFVVDVEQRADDRGYFARAWCQREFADMGLSHEVVQCNLSHTTRRGTLRGMHWQAAPYGEAKLVRCTRGSVWDVIIDLRPDSPTYTRHFGVELTSGSARALFVPEGFAHGFVTLDDETDVLYQMSQFYEPSAARGVRWNDPAFGIAWPISDPLLHPRDAHYPDFVRESKP